MSDQLKEQNLTHHENKLSLPTINYVLFNLDELIKQYELRPRKEDNEDNVDDYQLKYETYQLTALIPGFYDPEIEKVNQGENPQFPDVGSQEMLDRLKLAKIRLKNSLSSGKPITYQDPVLTDVGKKWLHENVTLFIQEVTVFSTKRKDAEELHSHKEEGYNTWTCCNVHRELNTIHEGLSKKGFQLSVIAPGFYKDDQQDTSFVQRRGNPSVPQVGSEIFMTRIQQYAS